MDSPTIDRVLRKNCPIYRGTFACDELPVINIKPYVIVVNTDPASQPGQHWICIFVAGDKHGEYFGSFGLPPKRVFERYMNNNCIAWTLNRKQMQSLISRFCGHYCIWYCMMKYRRVALNELQNAMTNDTGLNDFLIHRFACQLIYSV
jgi:hypothetical protein